MVPLKGGILSLACGSLENVVPGPHRSSLFQPVVSMGTADDLGLDVLVEGKVH